MRQKRVAVLDYGIGNVHSVANALHQAGATVTLTAHRKEIADADGLVVPGVGAFSAVMAALERVHGPELIGRRLSGGRAVLGICVGLQVLFSHGLEGVAEQGPAENRSGINKGDAFADETSRGGTSSPQVTRGLDQWPGEVRKLRADILPHMGWNTVEAPPESVLFEGIGQERFYFVHSYAATEWTLDVMPPFPVPRVTWAEHGERFIAAVENGALMGTQFHPEKSGAAGLKLLRNWLGNL